MPAEYNGTEIAIVGMAGRFPKSKNLAEFWRNLREGVECISFLTDEELAAGGVPPEVRRATDYVRAAPLIDDMERFDASYFGYSPREAEVIDPQHRVFLECAVEALEDAGYDPDTYDGAVGVFAGTAINTYLLFNLMRNPGVSESLDQIQINIANDKDYLTTRVSYKLNLKGPSHLVQSACSTSLLAVHVACQSLLNEECDMALAGGVTVNVNRRYGYNYLPGGMASPDGHCRAYDAEGQGTVFGSGAGLVVLKRLEEAVRDGDHIHAVIRGSAINNDGSLKVGYTAPSVDGQAEVIAEALANAGLTADEIGYVEGHGTGTPLGDPVEVRALTKAFRASTQRKNFCALGSVKTNVGHLDSAAGVAGLIKAVLAVSRGEIPPTLHFRQPNPQIDFASSPFYVNSDLRQWERPGGGKRRAGVSSFGVGGTNAHVVIEEAPGAGAAGEAARPAEVGEEGGPRREVLTVSARTPEALAAACARLGEYLRDEGSRLRLADVAHTLRVGRRRFAHRAAAVCRSVEEAAEAFGDATGAASAAAAVASSHGPADRPGARTSSPALWRGEAPSTPRPLIFVFPGQGVELAGSALSLYKNEQEFARRLDECAAALLAAERATAHGVGRHNGDGAGAAVAPANGEGNEADVRAGLLAGPGEQSDRWQKLFTQTRRAQPALFAYEYALSHLLISWGLTPSAAAGHSLGEYAAACVGGHLTLAEAASLVVSRARLMQEAPEGAMLAVGLGADEASERAAKGGLWVSAVNGERQSVVGGSEEAVERLRAELKAEGVGSQRLGVSRAFHTGLMTEAAARLAELAGRVLDGGPAKVNGAGPKVGGAASVGAVPVVSGVSGGWMRGGEAREAGYWARQMREPVRFWEALRTAAGGPAEGGGWGAEPVVIEVGPGVALSRAAQALASGAKRGKAGSAPSGMAEAPGPNGAGASGEAGANGMKAALGGSPSEPGLAASVAAVPRPGGGDEATQVREAAARLWCWGVAPSWEKLGAAQGRRRRVPLPTYPFERQRFWVSPTEAAEGRLSQLIPAQVAAGVADDVGAGAGEDGAAGAGADSVAATVPGTTARVPVREWLYLPSWRPTLSPPPSPSWDEGRGSLWLVFDEGRGLGGLVAAGLRDEGRAVAVVRRGTAFSHPAPGEYEVGEGEGDYERLMREAAAEAGAGGVRGVVHLWATAPRGSDGAAGDGARREGESRAWLEEFEWAQRDGYYSLLRVARAAALCGAAGGVMEAVAVTAGMQAAGGEGGRAEMATALGVCKVAGQESEWARWAAVDVERGDGEGWAERAAGRVMAEVRGGLREAEVAWRGARRWARSYEQVRVEPEAESGACLRRGGVYLITGGLDGIGFEVAKHLARAHGARLVLVEDVPAESVAESRPPAAAGVSLRTDDGIAPAAPFTAEAVRASVTEEEGRRGRRVSLLKEAGAEVLVERADVADEAQMRGVVARAAERFGKIDGVVHAAGVVGARTFRAVGETGEAESAWHFRPKVFGAYVLEKIFGGAEIDFCLLASSLSSVLGGRGLAAYSAANRFLDAFAQTASRTTGFPLLSVNFDAWEPAEDEGSAKGPLNARLERHAMTGEEGAEAFERALSMKGFGQVLVSVADPARRAAELEAALGAARSSRGAAAAATGESNEWNVASGASGAGRGLEEIVTAAWRRNLGVREVGPDDNFFDLGGDSLIAIQVISQLKKELGVEIPVVSLYEGLTVRYLVGLLKNLKDEETRPAADAPPAREREERASRRRDYIERARAKKAPQPRP